MTEVLIADAENLVRTGLRFVLEEDPDIHVVAEACSGDEAVAQYQRCRPDIAVLEIAMPDGEGLLTIRQLKDLDPKARILVVTRLQPGLFATRTFKAGAMGYMTKAVSAPELRRAVRSVKSRRRFFRADGASAPRARAAAGPPDVSPIAGLSDRELQVLWLMVRGHKLSQIASMLSLSNKTVETYRKRFTRKLGIRNDADVYRFARRHGFD